MLCAVITHSQASVSQQVSVPTVNSIRYKSHPLFEFVCIIPIIQKPREKLTICYLSAPPDNCHLLVVALQSQNLSLIPSSLMAERQPV